MRARKYEVAVLPTGAVEPHNLHLPYGQDVRHTVWIARRACAAAWKRGAAVVCLPAIPYGVDCNLMDFPLTIQCCSEGDRTKATCPSWNSTLEPPGTWLNSSLISEGL